MFEPELLLGSLYFLKPFSRNIGIHIPVVSTFDEKERDCELVHFAQIRCDEIGQQIRSRKLVTVPDVLNLPVAVIGRELGEIAIGRAVFSISTLRKDRLTHSLIDRGRSGLVLALGTRPFAF